MDVQEAFIKLVRLGLGQQVNVLPLVSDWQNIGTLANEHGLLGVVMDGMEVLSANVNLNLPPKKVLLKWIGHMMQEEQMYATQDKAAAEMALLMAGEGIRTYVLKGAVIAECYPKPCHRRSVDMDCFLMYPGGRHEEAWDCGNRLMQSHGFNVDIRFYKNSSFLLPGLKVENHLFMTPWRGNKTLKSLEQLLHWMMDEDAGQDRIKGAELYRPPVMVSALFLIEHAYSHFLHEGLSWRHVLDWALFSRSHQTNIDWTSFDASIDAFGFRKFYESYVKMGRFLLGELSEDELNAKDKMMLADVWAPLDLHETRHGVKGKLALAGNTWRARWKYRHFAEISMPHALWIQVKGFLFMKNPTLE